MPCRDLLRHYGHLTVLHWVSGLQTGLLLPAQGQLLDIFGHHLILVLRRILPVPVCAFVGLRRRRQKEGDQGLLLLVES